MPGPALRARHTDPTVVIDDYARYVHIDRTDYDNLVAAVDDHLAHNDDFLDDVFDAAAILIQHHNESVS